MGEDDDDDEVQVVNGRDNTDYSKIDKWFDEFRDESDSIEVNGIMKFAEALGIDPETDPVILVLAEVMKAKQMLHFSRDEFRLGMKTLNVDSTSSLKKILPKLRESIKDKRKFKNFYIFLYGYALDFGQKVMTKDMAIGLWKLLFPEKFALFPRWIDYFERTHKHGVSKDLWTQFLVFSELPGISDGDYTAFDQIESWPLVLDEFVSSLRG